MAELRPYPFPALVRRMVRELERHGSVYDLPGARFVTGPGDVDLATRFHGHPVSSPLGPAAGPHTQMAQNLVLAWLGGSRIFELKTVQIRDDLTIPRPCIDMRTVGYNAEWSQELRLGQSLEEYVKGAMLVTMLARGADAAPADLGDAFAATRPAPGFGDAVFDLSVGYDLAGIRSEPVQAFIRGMTDARESVERFRDEIPKEFGGLRDLDYPVALSDSVTLSTFHGCPPEEIESIIAFLLRDVGLHCVVKFNPMLLGPETLRGLLHDTLGYRDIRVPDSAFTRDATWEQATGMVERLGALAASLGRSFGVKFSNTLIVENTAGFLPASEREVYLSGAPLHVLAIHLVDRFRRRFGDRYPISFAAGIDARNFPDAAALGLVPITTCSDLLGPQGYGRLHGYAREAARRMTAVGAATLDAWILGAYGQAEAALVRAGVADGDPRRAVCLDALRDGGDLRAAAGEELLARWVSEAKLLNTAHYAAAVAADGRYALAGNSKLPKKIGRRLKLFDCVTCDKCLPVCPNDANFTFDPPSNEFPIVKVSFDGAAWTASREGVLELTEKHQIANFADFCNECGNCDVFCPEDGGPYVLKPRFFGTEADWRLFADRDGFHVARDGAAVVVLGRMGGRDYRLVLDGDRMAFTVHPFTAVLSRENPEQVSVATADSFAASAGAVLDLTPAFILDAVGRGVLDPARVNPVNILAGV